MKPIKEIHQNQNQNQNQHPQKSEPSPSWLAVRGLLTCKDLQKQQQQEQALEETSKKCKKMKCSGSLCSNTKVMHRPETASPEIQRKRAAVRLTSNNNTSCRSMKAPLNTSSLSVSSNSSINGASGSFKGMPFRRLSGCYECRMVVDPVIGFTRDPSLRSSICSCPECGEIFVKPENRARGRSFASTVTKWSSGAFWSESAGTHTCSGTCSCICQVWVKRLDQAKEQGPFHSFSCGNICKS